MSFPNANSALTPETAVPINPNSAGDQPVSVAPATGTFHGRTVSCVPIEKRRYPGARIQIILCFVLAILLSIGADYCLRNPSSLEPVCMNGTPPDPKITGFALAIAAAVSSAFACSFCMYRYCK